MRAPLQRRREAPLPDLPLLVMVLAAAVLAATYLGYPVWLGFRARAHPRPLPGGPPARWPTVTIVVVVRNAERSLRELLHNLLALAYPPDRRRILVVSNGSSDFTDAVAGSLAPMGVRLLRVMRARPTASAAENLARRHVHSDLVVVVHPDARLQPAALAALVAPFADPTVGVAYGQEVGAPPAPGARAPRRSPAARYEAWLRDAESRVFGTVSARRALFAVRTGLYRAPVASMLSPDFAPILLAREHGFRAVYVPDAVSVLCSPRSLRGAYGVTVRTVTRDVATMLVKPHLLDPRRYGAFAGILLGHKLGRWLAPWALAGLLGALAVLAPTSPWARDAIVAALLPPLAAALPWLLRARPASADQPAPFAVRAAASSVAVAHAGLNALRGLPLLPFASPGRVAP